MKKNNSGFRVKGHNLNDFNEGEEYEFVLKDKNVLDQQDDELDELENLILLKQANKKKEKNKSESSVFNNYGNSEFNKKEILPQYGETNENQEEFIIDGKVGVRVGDQNQHNHEEQQFQEDQDKSNQNEELNKIKNKFKKLKEQNLNSNTNKINYLSNLQNNQVSQNSNNILNNNLNNNLNIISNLFKIKRPAVALSGLSGKLGKSESSLNSLNSDKKFTTDYMTQEEFSKTKKMSLSKDFKKKNVLVKKRIKTQDDNLDEEIKNISNLDSNIDRKESLINSIFNSNSNINPKVYDEYDELNFYLEKQRNLEQKKLHKVQELPEQKIEQILKYKEECKKNGLMSLEEKEDTNLELNTGNYYPTNFNPTAQTENEESASTEFISDTTVFLKKVPSKKEIEENYKLITSSTPISLKDIKSGTQSVMNVPLPTDRLRFGVSSIVNNIQSPIKLEDKNKFLNKKRKGSILEQDQEEEDEISVQPITGQCHLPTM